MKLSHLIPALVVSALLPLAGCDKEPDPAQKEACEKFAAQLAKVVQQDQGEEVPKEQVDKMLEATTEKCLESPPKDDQMKCAMAAQDLKSMKACDPKDEDEEKK